MRRNGFRLAFQFLCWEAAFAIAYETWIGPIYLSGIAGELGVKLSLMGLLATIPWIGPIGQLFGIWAYERSPSLRLYTLRFATAARALWAIPVIFAWYWGLRAYHAGRPFPADRWFTVTLIAAWISSLLGSLGGVSWLAWTRALVPGKFHGRFFGVRQRYTMAAVVVAHGIGVFWVSWKPHGFHLGYGIMLLCALSCAALSTLCLARVPDAAERAEASGAAAATAASGPVPIAPALSWLETIREPFADPTFRRVILFGACFNGAVQLAGPYFPYYFTRELHLPMSTIAYWTLLTNAGWFLAAVAWGKKFDRSRRLGMAFGTAIVGVCISPIYYVIPSVSWVRFIGPLDYFTNGIAWGGYTLLITSLQLRTARPGRTAVYCSVYAATAGLAGALTTLLGARLAIWLEPWGGFRALWALAVAARLGVAWALAPMLSQAMAGAGANGAAGPRETFEEVSLDTSEAEPALVEPI